MGEESHNRITASQDWTHFSINVSNFDSRTFAVVMYIHMGGVGTAWYDNISVKEILPKPGVAGEVTADIPSGEVDPGQEVWLTTGSEDADIYYTTDGSDPTTSDTRYYYTGKPVIVTEDMTVQAVAIDENGPGKIMTYNYTVSGMLIENGGFEDGKWNVDSLLECSSDSSEHHSGSKSMKIEPVYAGSITSNWVKLDTRYDYELSFWAKTEAFSGDDSAYVSIKIKDMSGNEGYYERYERLIELPADSDWTEYKIYMGDLCYTQAQFLLASDTDIGTIWLDDVKLIAKQDNSRPVTIIPSAPEVFGGIYYNSLYDPLFSINMGALISNVANCEQKITVEYYTVNMQSGRDYPGATIENFVIPGKIKNAKLVDGGNDKLDLSSVSEYGVYNVVFTVTDEVGYTYEAGNFDITRSNWEDGSVIDWFGIGTHELSNNENERLDTFRKAGIGAMRWGAMWESVEKTKGVYTFDPENDRQIKLLHDKGFHVILLLGECNPLYNNGERPVSDADNQAFAEYCKATVAHFKTLGIKEYEMWNEYDYEAWLQGAPFSGAVEYSKTVKAAYSAMKKADPNCVVINGCTSGVNFDFIKKMMDEGGYEYTDAISLHPYCYQAEDGRTPESGGFIERCKAVYDMVNSYGNTKDIKIWITEFGFHTAKDYHGQTEGEAARNTIRSLALASANLDFIEKAYVYEEIDRLGINVRDAEHHFGINHGPNSVLPYSAKQVLPAMSAFSTKLMGATYKTTHQYGNSLITMNYGAVVNHEYKYSDGRSLFLLYDVDNIGRKLSVKLKSDDADLYDMYGNTKNLKINDSGEFVLELNGDVQYLVLGKGNSMVSAELVTAEPNNDKTASPEQELDDDYEEYEEYIEYEEVSNEGSDDGDIRDEEPASTGGRTVIKKVRRVYNNIPWWVYVIIGVAAVLVIGGTVTFIILFRRRKRTKTGQ